MTRNRRYRSNLGRGLVLIAALALAAVACGESESTTTQAPTTQAPTTQAPTTQAPTTQAPETTAATTTTTEAMEEEMAPMEPTTVRLHFNWLVDPGFGGYYVALDQGYYTDENLEVELIHGGPNVPNPVQVLSAGTADIGTASPLVIAQAVNEGADYVVIGTRFQTTPFGMSSLPDNPIHTAADIVGKKIGGGAFDAVFLDALLVLNGLEPGSYELVPIGFDPAPLPDGLVDGIANYMVSHPVILTARGIDNVAVSYADMGMPLYGDMIFVNRSFLEENREAVVGFLRATIKGWEKFFQDPDLGFDLMFDQYGAADNFLVREEQLPVHEAQVELMTNDLTAEKGLFWMDLDLIAGDMYDVLRAAGVTDPPPVDSLFDTSILEEAFGDDGPNLLG